MINKRPRFLFLRGGAIGDFVLTLPALTAVRDNWPEAYIEVLGYPHIARLAQAGGLADSVRSLDDAGMARFFSLRPVFPAEQIEYIRSFDIIFSYLHDMDGTVRNNLELAGARMVIYGSPIVDDGHAVDHLLKPLESLAIYNAGAAPRLDLDVSFRRQGRGILESAGITPGAVAMHPGSGSLKKVWPTRRFVSLARRVTAETSCEPFFIIGEADETAAESLRREAADIPVLSNCSLSDLAGVLSLCSAFIGNDSGITHLAAALDIPVVAMYGPTDPDRWGARGSRVVRLKCPGGGMESLQMNDVFNAMKQMLEA